MFGSLQLTLIGVALSAVIAFGGGWTVRGWKCDAAVGRAQAQHDQRQLDARDAADGSEATLFPEQTKDLSTLEDKSRDLGIKISTGECFSAGDVDRLRDLWTSP